MSRPARLATCLRDIVALVHEGLSPEAKETVFVERRQPRTKNKLVIR
mgnify:FL=1|jgi:hypothetical protein